MVYVPIIYFPKNLGVCTFQIAGINTVDVNIFAKTNGVCTFQIIGINT